MKILFMTLIWIRLAVKFGGAALRLPQRRDGYRKHVIAER